MSDCRGQSNYSLPYRLLVSLADEYEWARNNPRDIHEHLPYLAELASQCNHVTEFGIGLGMSDRAFLRGLQRPDCVLISYDLNITPEAKRLLTVRSICRYLQIQADVLQIEICETEMLFIDTLHNYSQLLTELTLHERKVAKMIAIHDTVSFGYWDECPPDGSRGMGLMPAIDRFIRTNAEWKITEHRPNCNGLLVLGRVCRN